VRCVRCEHDNPVGAKFCNGCGAPLAVACPVCGHTNPAGSRFCNACGAGLAAGTPTSDTRGFASPERYTPGHLAQKILGAGPALAGERKQVTVLFADMKGSMELLADRDPEEARRLLDPVLERMMAAVHRYEGTVNQVMGDGIMALFGAPLAHEDHAVRACYAALDMQREMARYTEETRRDHGVEVQIRVGLNSGGVVVRAIGSDLRMDYSAVGQTTHLAARMEQLAPPASIRLTAETLALAEGLIQVRPLGPVPIKGVGEPVEVFELTGVAPSRTRLQAAAGRGLTRFVGREDELRRLRHALDEARAGRGQIVGVVGEAGVGKSRLYWEFIHSHRTDGCLVLESSSVSYGKATPYLPLVDLLKRYFEVDGRDDARRTREKVTGKLLTLDEGLRPSLSALLALLEVPAEDPAWDGLSPEARRLRTTEAVKRVFLRESQGRPVIVVAEDLHWVDRESQTVLDGLVESVPTARILLLVNYRPEFRHGWGGKTYYTQIRLDPLGRDSAEELLVFLLGPDPALQGLRDLLVARTDGNPFFIEECVQALAEARVLEGKRGAYRLLRSADAIHVPATVQAVVAARIDRLPPEDKALLQTAAVIGKDVPFLLLQAVAGLPEDVLRLGLARLQTAEFLYETSLFPELEYTFKHALTHETAYGSLLHERRRELHVRIVEACDRLWPEATDERADWLAQHAFRGELWGRAVSHLRRIPDDPDAIAVVGARESVGRHWWLGDHARALAVAQQDLAVAVSFRNFWMQVVSRLRLGQVCHSRGDYAQALEHLARNAAALEPDVARERPPDMAGLPSVLTLTWQALCLAELGRFAEGVERGLLALELAEGAAQPYSLIDACAGLGSLHLSRGDLDAALPLLERGVALARVENIVALVPLMASPLGAAYAMAGRDAEAVAVQEQAIEHAVSMKLMANQPLRLARLGEAHLLAGRLDRAADAATRARELARELREHGHEAYALRVLAEVFARSAPADVERARSAFDEATALARQLGMRPLLAHCHLGLSALLARIGLAAEAEVERVAAAGLLENMQMRPWGRFAPGPAQREGTARAG
jgi:class 3 adenylate cyclase/tetratricopeptide (TPR) repeat protein